MYLGKSCHAEHSLKVSEVLRVGTLYSYRRIENPEIVDKGEGRFSVELQIDGPAMIENWIFGSLSNGVISLGGGSEQHDHPELVSGKVNHLEIIKFQGNSVVVGRYDAVFNRQVSNCFIFCMSAFSHIHDLQKIFGRYESYWYVYKGNALEIGKRMASALRLEIIERHSRGSFVVDSSLDLNNFSISVRVMPVSYGSRLIRVKSLSRGEYYRAMKIIRNAAFLKPNKDSHQMEVRFQLLVLSNGKEFPPVVDYIDIASSGIRKMAMYP